MEEWRVIPNFSLYQASTNGDIKTFNWKNHGIERVMKPAHDGSGYFRTMLKRDDGVYATVKVHRIIALTFLENIENKPQVNHINGIRDDNRVENLEWCTPSENMLHCFKRGAKSVVGEKNPAAQLTEKQVLEIRSKYTYGRKGGKKGKNNKDFITKLDLAIEYHVGIHVIKNIVTGRTWKHLL